MPSINEYFETDHRGFRFRVFAEIKTSIKRSRVEIATIYDLEANSRYIAMCFAKDTTEIGAIYQAILKYNELADKPNMIVLGEGIPNHAELQMEKKEKGVADFSYKLLGEEELLRQSDIIFTKRIYIYTPNVILEETRQALRKEAHAHGGLQLVFRDGRYAAERDQIDTPRAFISHDSRDKDDIATPIARRLIRMGCPVWYSQFSLSVGDSLKDSIEYGLKTCKKCIFILSPSFLVQRRLAKERI